MFSCSLAPCCLNLLQIITSNVEQRQQTVRQLLHTSALRSAQSVTLSNDDMLDHLVRLTLDVQGAAEAGQAVHPETAKELAAVAAGAQAALGRNSASAYDLAGVSPKSSLGGGVARKVTNGSSASSYFGESGNGVGQEGPVADGVAMKPQAEIAAAEVPGEGAGGRNGSSSRGSTVEAAVSIPPARVEAAAAVGAAGTAGGASSVGSAGGEQSTEVGELQIEGVRLRHQGGNGQEGRGGGVRDGGL